MVDPHVRCGRSGRAPPSRARRLRSRERREEQQFEYMVEIRSNLMRGRRRGQPFGKEQFLLCVNRVPPPPLFIGGGGGQPPWRRGQPLGVRPRVSSLGGGRPRVSPKEALALQGGGRHLWAPLVQVAPSHLGLPSERGPIDI